MGGSNAKAPDAKTGAPAASSEKAKTSSSAAPATRSKEEASSRSARQEPRIIMGKYKMGQNRDDIMGKGTSSICYKGEDMATGRPVAIKLYREQKGGTGKIRETTMQKFRRQISVLNELMEPFKEPEDPKLWTDILKSVKPRNLFMELIDYSKNEQGEPGPHAEDGTLYVVTELAQYSLKDLLADRRHKKQPFSKEATRDLAKRMLLAMAGLHAKGFVHIDMKPENVMVFDGRLKVIDVDGCVRSGTKVSINDGSISFSPCYCSPEWARFMIKETEQVIVANPHLDVWSVGMTFCEFVALDAIWKPQYANFMRNAASHREAGFLFLEWLGVMKKPPLPRAIEGYNKEFYDLLVNWLLVCDPKQRKTCAEALENPYLAEGGWARYGEGKQEPQEAQGEVAVVPRVRLQDDSTGAPVHKGTVWKLNTNGDPSDPKQWIKRDMWLAQNRSVCYYSVKENKRLVLIDGEKLRDATIEAKTGTAKEFAIEIAQESSAEEKMPRIILGFDTQEELDAWMDKICKVGKLDAMMTFFLGAKMAEDIQAFKLAVNNRRLKVESNKTGFDATYKAKLWKLKSQGDKTKEEDWFLRDMWITDNGSLVYYSPKEERDLVYYTAQDLGRSWVEEIEDDEAHHKNTLTICMVPQEGGVEFDPGVFAAENSDLRVAWIQELNKVAGGKKPEGKPESKLASVGEHEEEEAEAEEAAAAPPAAAPPAAAPPAAEPAAAGTAA